MSCDLPVPRIARALKVVFLLANALVDVVSSELQLEHFGGGPEGEGQRQQAPARGFDEQGSKSRTFPTRKSPGVFSAPLSVSSSFRGKPTSTSRLARALSLRPVGWEEGPGKSSAAVAMQEGETSALLEVTATTTTTYESLGSGICACRSPTRKNGLERDLCNSEVFVPGVLYRKNFTGGGFVPAPPPKEYCRSLCSDAADCMAYQDYWENFEYARQLNEIASVILRGVRGWCLLYLWHRVPIGVFGAAERAGRSDFSESLKNTLWLWREVPCMRKVVQELTDRRSRSQLESVEKFAIMPREQHLNESGRGPDRFCTCRATTPTGGYDTEEKETVCRVADERANMSQEAAESLCLERNRREAALLRGSTNETDIESALRGCAGFMSFTPLNLIPRFTHRMHPKANHVLFFSGNQTVTGIAATREQYKQKGGKLFGLANSYLNPWSNSNFPGSGELPGLPEPNETQINVVKENEFSVVSVLLFCFLFPSGGAGEPWGWAGGAYGSFGEPWAGGAYGSFV